MSIFITGLALAPDVIARAKLAILVGSVVASLGGLAILAMIARRKKVAPASAP